MGLGGLRKHSRIGLLLPVLLTMVMAAPAAAFQFNLGDVEGNLDTTLSYGLSWRMADRDKDLVGIRNGGNAYSLNGDDGNLNYDEGELISNIAKITTDLELSYIDVGLFVRGSAFYDFENEDGERERTRLSDAALDLVGSDVSLLDNYVWWNFEFGDVFGQVRIGEQVLSWGESTFIQNSINSINPIDVNKIRVPGAELKEALLPVGMVSASVSPNEYLTFEGFYQYDWEATEIDPPGSYWSTNGFAGAGGDRVMLGFGAWSDLGERWGTHPIFPGAVELMGYPAPDAADSRFNMVPRGSTVYADNNGQYGVAMRVYAPALNDTEFGFYYMNYHSRLPVVSARTGTGAGALQTLTAGTAAGTFAALSPTIVNTATLVSAVTTSIDAGTLAGSGAGLPASFAEAIASGAVNAALQGGGDLAAAYATNEYAQTAEYIIEYPEDIKLYGISFNTTLGSSGVALQGEVSHRRDVPLQVDDLELLFAALGPVSPALASGNQLFDTSTLADPYEHYIQGYKRMDVSQVQATATKLFGPTFGADQFLLLGEVGWTHVHDMPDKDELRFEGPGTYISGNRGLAELGVVHAPTAVGEYEDSDHFADADSWGYRAVAKLDFNNAIGAVTLSPRVAWNHDVDGISPGPGGNFLEGRKAITFGLGFNYLNTWTADVSYTDFFGAGRYNLVNDRDFLAFNLKYSF